MDDFDPTFEQRHRGRTMAAVVLWVVLTYFGLFAIMVVDDLVFDNPISKRMPDAVYDMLEVIYKPFIDLLNRFL